MELTKIGEDLFRVMTPPGMMVLCTQTGSVDLLYECGTHVACSKGTLMVDTKIQEQLDRHYLKQEEGSDMTEKTRLVASTVAALHDERRAHRSEKDSLMKALELAQGTQKLLLDSWQLEIKDGQRLREEIQDLTKVIDQLQIENEALRNCLPRETA